MSGPAVDLVSPAEGPSYGGTTLVVSGTHLADLNNVNVDVEVTVYVKIEKSSFDLYHEIFILLNLTYIYQLSHWNTLFFFPKFFFDHKTHRGGRRCTNVVSKSESHVECVAPAVDGAKDVNVPMDVVVQVLGVSTKVGTYMYQAPLIESKYNFKNLFVLFFGY